jgi:hypothetical protein
MRRTTKAKRKTQARNPKRAEKEQIQGGDDKEACIKAFMEIVELAQKGRYSFSQGVADMGDYMVVHEDDREGSSFVHVVPKSMKRHFMEMRKKTSDTFLGFSILCGKNGSRDLRVSCFGVPTTDITKAIIKRR